MELIEGEHFNTIGMDSDPPKYGTDEQIRTWAKNAFLEMLSDTFTYGHTFNIEEYVQTKIVELPS
jgi:hypothetical protein